MELLQGRFSKGVMERICRQGTGLFPKPSEIRFSCSCPDDASMCKHVAAVLYGVGARLDAKPELLFRLRAVNENDLVADIGDALPMAKQGPAAGKVLEADDMAALFGLDMGEAAEPVEVVIPLIRQGQAAGKKEASGVKAGTPKGLPAKKVAPTATAARKAEPKPVEWWKPGALKEARTADVPARKTVRVGAARKIRAVS